MCRACQRNDCARCDGCWHEITHAFDRDDDYDDHAAARAEDAYEYYYDRQWGDAA